MMVQGENTYTYKDSWNTTGDIPIRGMWTGETSFPKVSTGASFLTVTAVTDSIDVQYPPFLRRRCCGCARHVNTYRCCHCVHNTCSSCSVEMPTPNGVDYPPFQSEEVTRSQQRSWPAKQLSLSILLQSSVFRSLLRSWFTMPRPAGEPQRPWNYGMNWQEQTIEYNRVIVDYVNMTETFQQAFQKTILHPVIRQLGSQESKSLLWPREGQRPYKDLASRTPLLQDKSLGPLQRL
eukprot:6169455-Amphidinium_carterae.3